MKIYLLFVLISVISVAETQAIPSFVGNVFQVGCGRSIKSSDEMLKEFGKPGKTEMKTVKNRHSELLDTWTKYSWKSLSAEYLNMTEPTRQLLTSIERFGSGKFPGKVQLGSKLGDIEKSFGPYDKKTNPTPSKLIMYRTNFKSSTEEYLVFYFRNERVERIVCGSTVD